MGFNVGLAVGRKLQTTLVFWTSATGRIKAGGALSPEMGGLGGGWFPGSVRCSSIGC